MRGAIELRLCIPPNVNGISANPQPDWSFDELISELNLIYSDSPSPFIKIEPRDLKAPKPKGSFVMHVSDHEINSIDNDDVEADTSCMVSGGRFATDETYMSCDGTTLGMQCNQLMDQVNLADGAVHELRNGYRSSITEEVRSKISSMWMVLVNEKKKFDSITTNIEKYRESQKERARKLDLQYQRHIAEALDNHLTALRMDHDHISQIEERAMNDMSRVVAKIREEAIHEEKLWQERIRSEDEARPKIEMGEQAMAETIETEKKAAKEPAPECASGTLNMAHNDGKLSKEAHRLLISTVDVKNGIQSSVRNIIQASENALESEKRRQQVYEELSAEVKLQKEGANKVYVSHERNIGKLIRTVQDSSEVVRTKVEELGKLINSPHYPQSISIKSFAEKIVSSFSIEKSLRMIFAASRVAVLVISKIPLALDNLIAELNRVCIYTVPKHISYSEKAFKTKDDYFKALGYKEVYGKIEGTGDYVGRLRRYMKLYGALLVQGAVGGYRQGHAEGWAWLARFLNTLPANLFTANALDSFLEVAGYELHRQYKNQFEKLLRVITREFLTALQIGDNEDMITQVKNSIQGYVNKKLYKEIPDGFNLRTHLVSKNIMMEELQLNYMYAAVRA